MTSFRDTPGAVHDPRFWAAATWTVPLWLPLVLGLVFVCVWAFGKVPVLDAREGLLVIVSTLCAASLSGTIALLASRQRAPWMRGAALGLAGVSALILVGGIVFGLSVG